MERELGTCSDWKAFFRVKHAQLDAGVLHHRVLGVELAERIHLLPLDHRRCQRALAHHDEVNVSLGVHPGRRNESFRHP